MVKFVLKVTLETLSVTGLSLGLRGVEEYSAEGGEDLSRFRNRQLPGCADQGHGVTLPEREDKAEGSRPPTNALISGQPRVATPVTCCVQLLHAAIGHREHGFRMLAPRSCQNRSHQITSASGNREDSYRGGGETSAAKQDIGCTLKAHMGNL